MKAFGSHNRQRRFNALEGDQNLAEAKQKLLQCKVDGLFHSQRFSHAVVQPSHDILLPNPLICLCKCFSLPSLYYLTTRYEKLAQFTSHCYKFPIIIVLITLVFAFQKNVRILSFDILKAKSLRPVHINANLMC